MIFKIDVRAYVAGDYRSVLALWEPIGFLVSSSVKCFGRLFSRVWKNENIVRPESSSEYVHLLRRIRGVSCEQDLCSTCVFGPYQVLRRRAVSI